MLWPAGSVDWSVGYSSDRTKCSWVWLYTALSVSFEINWRLLTGIRFEREALEKLSTQLESVQEPRNN